MRTFSWQQVASLAIFLYAANYANAQTAQSVAEPGDPARWYQADTTQHDYATTLIKEAQAALLEAQKDCRAGESSARKVCLKEAQDQFKTDLSTAKLQDTKSSGSK